MIDHQFSARFKKDTDEAFKNEEFERRLGEYFAGFIQCYPHLIIKEEFDNENETWIFKFAIEVPCEHEMAPCDNSGRILVSGEPFRGSSYAICHKCGYKP
ncbi:MAG: hypothetical protein JWR05_3477 [Mucilaginibacter sp.]|nr:hypothetical protein [Mucilaginibacter sp.]